MTQPESAAYAAAAMRMPLVVGCGLSLLAVSSGGAAQVEEERLRLMHESLAYTDVIDAFDGDDRFDLDVTLDYARLRDHGVLTREHTGEDGTRVRERIGEASHERSQLTLGVDVGLFRDLMAFVRLPLVFRDARALRGTGEAALAAESTPLFSLPVVAPTRAGLDYVAAGAAFAVLNQARRPWQPTWVVRVEGRRALGTPLSACHVEQGATRCGTQSEHDLDGDGVQDGTRTDSAAAGSSRAMSGLSIETRFARTFRYVEPFAGLSLSIAWPARALAGFDAGPRGAARARPGAESAATLGVGLIPWQNRGTYQRVALDLRLLGTHVARGTDYSVLFDALGSSSHPELARARYEGVRGSVPQGAIAACESASDRDCGVGTRTAFYGTTEIAPHFRYGGQLGIEVQAARYVRFAAGTTLQWVSAHALTGRDPCAGAPGDGETQQGDDGRTCAQGRVDARHRGVIDAPGKRFVLRDELLLGIYAHAAAQF